MNVNFKGVHGPKILLGGRASSPRFNEIDSKMNVLRLEFHLDDNENGNHLSRFKDVTAKTDLFKDKFAYLTPETSIYLDIEKSNKLNEYGYSISLSGVKIDQQDEKALFALSTFFCAMTKYLISLQSEANFAGVKYLNIINGAFDKVAKRALYKH